MKIPAAHSATNSFRKNAALKKRSSQVVVVSHLWPWVDQKSVFLFSLSKSKLSWAVGSVFPLELSLVLLVIQRFYLGSLVQTYSEAWGCSWVEYLYLMYEVLGLIPNITNKEADQQWNNFKGRVTCWPFCLQIACLSFSFLSAVWCR